MSFSSRGSGGSQLDVKRESGKSDRETGVIDLCEVKSIGTDGV